MFGNFSQKKKTSSGGDTTKKSQDRSLPKNIPAEDGPAALFSNSGGRAKGGATKKMPQAKNIAASRKVPARKKTSAAERSVSSRPARTLVQKRADPFAALFRNISSPKNKNA